jgi:uncharacterized protein (TIGR00297 family)
MYRDLLALGLSYLYVVTVVAVGEAANRLGLPRSVSRKWIHIGVGVWVMGSVALFTNRYAAAIPPITAAAANWIIHRRRLLRALETDPENLGIVWFPVAFALLILAGWSAPETVLGGILAMTFGDAMAALVGERWGHHPYITLGGRTKSMEGSLSMWAGTLAAVWWVTRQPGLAALAAVVATAAEAVGIQGRDNLWVPLAVAATIALGRRWDPTTIGALGLGATLAMAVGIAAWCKEALTPSGMLGAILTGTLLFGFGGWTGSLALIGFFLSSSFLSRLFRHRKREVEAEYAKTGTRDLGQALANGGVAALAVVLLAMTGDERYWGAVLGALAAANADTWATELGVLAKAPPRLITTLRPVPAGTSGAVSVPGTLAAAGGSLFVGVIGALADPRHWRLLPWVLVAGLAGAVVDSLLGATAQAVYWCPRCEKETERRIHHCGANTVTRRGVGWLTNDLVNASATLVGALVGLAGASVW